MRVTYLGQACTLIDVGGKRILTDPWLTEGAFFGTWFHTHILADAGVTPETCPKDVDCLFLSHEHEDHVDPTTLRHFDPQTPVLICQFPTPKFRHYLEAIGLRNIREVPPGQSVDLGAGVTVTVFGTAEYTNDAALLVEGEGCRLFNETDCKLHFADLERLGRAGIDIGFYMFSGANWYPMVYDFPDDVQREIVRRRRRALVRSFVERVRVTRPRVAVPASGPCTVLDPELLWVNSEERGIFIDPRAAVETLRSAGLPTEPLYMAASDVWDSRTGFEPHAPDSVREPRQDYIRAAAERMAPRIRARRAAEAPAGSDFGRLLVDYFNTRVAALTPAVRRLVGAKLGIVATGPQGGSWTVDFTAPGPDYVREGLAPDWTYKLETEDKLLDPFVSGRMPFLEDLLISLRVRCARRPAVYHEPLYHFLYDPDPKRLDDWYATHRP